MPYGMPKSDAERKKTHKALFGTDKLPPRGTGRVRVKPYQRKQKVDPDSDALRKGIVAEYEAVNMYEELAENAKDPKVKEVFLDIAKEEKTHVGEFQEMLLQKDAEQVTELKEGKKEVEEME